MVKFTNQLNFIQIAALALPFIVVLAMAGYHALQLQKAHFVTLPITGFDPRDPLRGHYIAFRYDWEGVESDISMNPNVPTCACIDAQNKVAFFDCFIADKTPSCVAILPIEPHGLQPNYKLSRFYVTDVLAKPLEDMLRQPLTRKFEIELSVMPDRRTIHPHRLLIDGQDWKKVLGIE